MRVHCLRSRGITGTLVLGLAAAGLAACSTLFATKIGDILKSPGAYEGKEVTVAGKVTSAHNLVVVKYYQVSDGTGEIAVVTENALPKEGENVRAKGKVSQAFAIGSSRLIVILEQPPSR
jgi:hypothetical protein